MNYQMIFQRYEKKYIISADQKESLMEAIGGRLASDEYGSYTIANLYYDTERFELARGTGRKQAYKEKLRMRSYGKAGDGKPVFLELKKKFRGVVYKRRSRLELDEAASFFSGNARNAVPSDQILREIRRFIDIRQKLEARVFLAYDRTAYSGVDDPGLRVTFDTGIRFRRNDLRLDRESWGKEIMDPGKVLMEIKTPAAIPLWLCCALSERGIFPVSFSKYGRCCADFLCIAKENGCNEWREYASA
ncbi:MAG: polyphosphate polymerase domain-containing protein [Treponema sp.]|jgi:SPX domain protein involved in polyphosphate accumulation|nr:polyphosphate polymerase domain-containing protein [Treponema sp.]